MLKYLSLFLFLVNSVQVLGFVDSVLEFEGLRPKVEGPNCWNLSLVSVGILPAIRFSRPEEMSHYMSSPLCTKLDVEAISVYGDIGAIRTPLNEEVHGFVYISENEVYTKNGSTKKEPYQVTSLKSVLSEYQILEAPLLCQLNPNAKHCINILERYRCISLAEYLIKEGLDRGLLKEILFEFDHLEQTIETLAFFPSKVLEVDMRIEMLKLLKEKIKTFSKEASLKHRKFILKSLSLRVYSSRQQLGRVTASYWLWDENKRAESKKLASLISELHKFLMKL